MSQVRKLLQGKLIPKAQEGYKFRLDSQDYTVTDDQLKEIDNLISTLDPKHRRFLGNWTGAIKSGNSEGNRADNTVTSDMLSNLGSKDLKRLEKQKGSFWETLGEKDSYYAKEAIAEALNITASVLNKPIVTAPLEEEKEVPKTKFSKSEIALDFNKQNGKTYLSPTAESNILAKKRISDLLGYLQSGNQEYDYSDYNSDAIIAWLNGLEGEDKYNAGNLYFDNLWNAMGDKNGYEYNPDVEDLFSLFGINYGLNAPVTQPVTVPQATVTPTKATASESTNANGSEDSNTDNNEKEVVNVAPKLKFVFPTDFDFENPDLTETKEYDLIYQQPSGAMNWQLGYNNDFFKKKLSGKKVGNFKVKNVEYSVIRDPEKDVYRIFTPKYNQLIYGTFDRDYIKRALLNQLSDEDVKKLKYFDVKQGTWYKKEGGTIDDKTVAFKNKFRHIIKAQNGLSGLQFNFENIKDLIPEGYNVEDKNIIAYRPGVDWGTYVSKNGMGYYNTIGDLSPAPMIYPTSKAHELEAKDVFTDLYGKAYDPNATSYLSEYIGEHPVNEEVEGVEGVEKVGEATEPSNKIGGYPKNIEGLHKYLIPALSLARFGLNSHFQNKYYRQAVAALNAGRYNLLPTWSNLPRQDSPALDRQLQQVRLERMAGIKPVTSDLIANNALWNQRESQLYNRENDIVGKQSQFQWDAAKEGLNIMNQNLANQVATANENRAKTAAINSAIKQQAMELTQRRGQSWENLGLEIQNNLKKDKDVMLNYGKAQEQARLQKEYDRTIDQIFGTQARTDYMSLSADEAANYTDYDDYLNKKYNTIYTQNVNRIAKAQEDRINNMRKWLYLNGLNYSYPTFITGKSSPYGYKKGGYLRGSTRYTLEPDERIWIDNNKATHQAIAKLSDNTIKLLLRALK